jgi:hypothetical protein
LRPGRRFGNPRGGAGSDLSRKRKRRRSRRRRSEQRFKMMDLCDELGSKELFEPEQETSRARSFHCS